MLESESRASWSRTVEYENQKQIPYPMVSGSDGGGDDFCDPFPISYHPFWVLLRPDGKVDVESVNYYNKSDWDKNLRALGLEHKDCFWEVPGTIEAEAYNDMNGVKTEECIDNGGVFNVNEVSDNDWMEYPVNVLTTGMYTVTFRAAVASGQGEIELIDQDAGASLGTAELPSTGGAQTWESVQEEMALQQGEMTLRVKVVSGGFNLNWISFDEGTSIKPSVSNVGSDGFDLSIAQNCIRYSIPARKKKIHVQIGAYTLKGSLVKILVNEAKSSGNYYMPLQVNNRKASGAYVIKLNAGNMQKNTVMFINQ